MKYKPIVSVGVASVLVVTGLDARFGSAKNCPTTMCSGVKQDMPPMDLPHTHTVYGADFVMSWNNNSNIGAITISGGGNNGNNGWTI